MAFGWSVDTSINHFRYFRHSRKGYRVGDLQTEEEWSHVVVRSRPSRRIRRPKKVAQYCRMATNRRESCSAFIHRYQMRKLMCAHWRIKARKIMVREMEIDGISGCRSFCLFPPPHKWSWGE